MSKADQGKLQNKLEHAIRHHSAGRLQKARQLYHKVLKIDSGHNDALHMLDLRFRVIQFPVGDRAHAHLDLLGNLLL